AGNNQHRYANNTTNATTPTYNHVHHRYPATAQATAGTRHHTAAESTRDTASLLETAFIDSFDYEHEQPTFVDKAKRFFRFRENNL
ncbi:hypothetical protein, partial [Actinotignum timonense]|uniref:hypothetical protein n=1 Tax=Actinotignum timonense TaxID=1870995 RepID=UPI002550176D